MFYILFYKTATNDNLFLTQDIYNKKSLVVSLSPQDEENDLPVFVKPIFFLKYFNENIVDTSGGF